VLKISISRVLSDQRSRRAADGLSWGLARLPGLWHWRLRYRHELSMLTPEQMRDVGLNPEIVRCESRKPFWKA